MQLRAHAPLFVKARNQLEINLQFRKKLLFFLYFFLDSFEVYDFEEGERSMVEGIHLLSHDSFLCSRSPSKDNGTVVASITLYMSLSSR